VSAYEWSAVREGETHAATKTSKNNTPESFIVGIGASGALLAGAAIVFVTLVGLVSFNVWPTGRDFTVAGNVELSSPTPNASAGGTSAPPSTASGQIASSSAGGATAVGGSRGVTGGNGQSGGGDGKGGNPKSGGRQPQTTTTPPTEVTNTGSGSAPSAPGTASKSPAHPVHPSHPNTPHQNVSTGPKGKDDVSSGGSTEVVTGKGPLSKPGTPPVSSDTEGTTKSKGHGSGESHGSGETETATRSKGHGSAKSKH